MDLCFTAQRRREIMKQLIAAVAGVLAFSSAAWSQDNVHEGDIQVVINADTLTLLGGHEDLSKDGYRIFEGELGTFLSGGGNPRWKGDEPGLDTENHTFTTGTQLFYSGWSNLSFWNGSQWASVVPNGEVLTIENESEDLTVLSPSSITPPGAALLGTVGALDNGKVHEHLDFVVDANGTTVPAVGAYRIGLFLSSNNYGRSDNFYLVFNRGLSEGAFEGAVQAMAVPEPETYALMVLGLLAVGFSVRRHRQPQPQPQSQSLPLVFEN